VRGVQHLMEPIFSALWTLVPALREFRALDFGPSGGEAGPTMKCAVHFNKLIGGAVHRCDVGHRPCTRKYPARSLNAHEVCYENRYKSSVFIATLDYWGSDQQLHSLFPRGKCRTGLSVYLHSAENDYPKNIRPRMRYHSRPQALAPDSE
jgi:hypothetical protein